MTEPGWYSFAIREIESAVARRQKRLNARESILLVRVKERVSRNIALTCEQEDELQKLHARATESRRLKW